jgi:hypothetical protein
MRLPNCLLVWLSFGLCAAVLRGEVHLSKRDA